MRKAPTAELRQLVDRLLDQGGLGRVESARLEELLDDPDAMRYYTDVVAQEAMMADALVSLGTAGGKAKRKHAISLRSVALSTAAAAACVAAVYQLAETSRRPIPGPVAFHESDVRVISLSGVNWEAGMSAVLPDGRLASKHVMMRSGLAELMYPNGVRVILEGPADYAIAGPGSGSLTSGKLVAHVPPEGTGFSVSYGSGRVVDLGTEFGLAVEEGKMKLSVFNGRVDLQLPNGSSRNVVEGQALAHDGGVEDLVREIPLDSVRFIRNRPSVELPWEIDMSSPGAVEFDVSQFVTKASGYLAVFKWLEGWDAVQIGDVELRHDGRTVAADPHFGGTGTLPNVRDNTFRLHIPSDAYSTGRWTLHAVVKKTTDGPPAKATDPKAIARGVLLLEQDFAMKAGPDDFVGRWSFNYRGRQYIREFRSDGSADLWVNGVPGSSFFERSRWECKDGVLTLWLPAVNCREKHILRDPRTLVFISNAYADAVKLEDP